MLPTAGKSEFIRNLNQSWPNLEHQRRQTKPLDQLSLSLKCRTITTFATSLLTTRTCNAYLNNHARLDCAPSASQLFNTPCVFRNGPNLAVSQVKSRLCPIWFFFDLWQFFIITLYLGFQPVSVHVDRCVVTSTKSGNPYIDMITPNIGIAVGGNGGGAKYCYEAGKMAARMIAKGHWDYELPADKFKMCYRIIGSKL